MVIQTIVLAAMVMVWLEGTPIRTTSSCSVGSVIPRTKVSGLPGVSSLLTLTATNALVSPAGMVSYVLQTDQWGDRVVLGVCPQAIPDKAAQKTLVRAKT